MSLPGARREGSYARRRRTSRTGRPPACPAAVAAAGGLLVSQPTSDFDGDGGGKSAVTKMRTERVMVLHFTAGISS